MFLYTRQLCIKDKIPLSVITFRCVLFPLKQNFNLITFSGAIATNKYLLTQYHIKLWSILY